MTDDPYRKFAEFYDLFHDEFGRFPLGNIEAFFRDLFENHGIRRALDCACGTAQYLPLLKELGCQVVGSDISEAMLERARSNLSSCGMDVPLVKADFRELDRYFSDPFDAVLCLGTSLPHLLERLDVAKMLENTRKILSPDGLLVVSQFICDKLIKEKPLLIPAINKKDFSRVFGVEYGTQSLKVHVLDLVHDDEKQGTAEYCFEYQIILQNDYQRLLGAAGYHDIEFFGDYDQAPYSRQTSDRMIIVALR
jgi:ubiquinone/menaquinone biosynthesis C-methylase UbiE